MKFLRALAVLLLASPLCPAAFAQIAADLSGRVLDASGAVIPGAHIDLTAAALIKSTDVMIERLD